MPAGTNQYGAGEAGHGTAKKHRPRIEPGDLPLLTGPGVHEGFVSGDLFEAGCP